MRFFLALSTIVLTVAARPAPLVAQQQQAQNAVSGVVVDSVGGRPIIGAQVTVEGTQRRALSDERGQFRLGGLTGQTLTIRVTRLGYQPVTRTVQVGSGDVRIALGQAVQALEQVVVTASGEQRLKEMGSSVGRVRVDSVAQTAAFTNLAEMVNSRVAGVWVKNSSGSSVGGTRIRIRGASSLSLANEPVVYVDGVRVNTENQALSWSANQQMPSRFNDIDPEQIESIDVLKGPSASTMYGTEAANGVILITTKSGARTNRRAEWTVWSERGRITEPNDYPANYSGRDAANATCLLTSVAAGTCVQARVDSFNLLMNPTTTPFKVGHRNVVGTAVAGGTPEVKYYVSGDYQDEAGVYRPVDGIEKINGRANVNVQPNEKVQLQVNAGYVQSQAKLFADGGTALGFVTNGLVGGPCNTCWFNWSPTQLAQIDAKQRVGRFIGSAMAQYQPTAWLQFRGQFGADALTQQDDRLIPIGALPARNPTGERTVGKNSGLRYNADFLARLEWPLMQALNSTSSFGAQYLSTRTVDLISLGTGLVPGSNSLAAAGQITTTEATTEIKTAGAYFEEQLAWRDRLFLTAGARTDQNSSFGKQFETIVYPKAGLSWVVSDEGFFPDVIPTSSLRVRFAWGQSGSQPGALNAVTYYGAFPMTTPEGTTQSGVTFATGNLGNPDLKPERSSEVEGGFDAGFLDERITLAVTYYRKITKDALVNRAVAPSVGATSGRWENLSKVRNAGWEGLLTAGLLNRGNVDASITFNVSYNKNKLLESGLPHVNGSSFTEGYPLGAYWSRDIISYADANNDGIIVPTEITVTDTAVFIGEVIPSLVASIQPTLTLFSQLRASAMISINNGAWLYNMGERMRCQGGQARARSDRAASLDEQARCVAAASLGVNGGLHHDASFTKLRELSLSYDVPQRWASRARMRRTTLTLAGQNLFTWTDYPGIDPDISSRGTNFSTVDYLQPASRRVWLLRVNANF